MPDKDKDAELRRMAKIREILTGIFDKGERRAVLSLVSDYEKLTGLGAQLAAVEAEKADLEERWLEVASSLEG